jgi:hypothetical protein
VAPPRYGNYAGPAPVPAFVAPAVQARPAPTIRAWTVRIGQWDLKAIAVPVSRGGKAPAKSERVGERSRDGEALRRG